MQTSETLPNFHEKIAQDGNHPLSQFAVIFRQPVAWGDMDAFNHVNNVKYHEYSQSARIHYLQQLEMFDKNVFTVLASSSCQYLRPVVFPDVLQIGVRIKKLGNTSIVHEYVYYSEMQNAVVATAETVLVLFQNDGKNKRLITDMEKQAILALEQQANFVPAS